ncbi:MAG: right-handed parallel beta-helix repeat-containing protein [Actinomycetota bacterium]|nr:right-handed parallel beta-helix repeat-containing protein [Actinomycetota bacterium]MDH5225207.1 right-handed parallel beta-helix repeat-containing protein [Actinomycetota bacterium]MDH5312593.1 right-handed parallel beta-helix repeat-containing protein [Actinomycetota bacterium]
MTATRLLVLAVWTALLLTGPAALSQETHGDHDTSPAEPMDGHSVTADGRVSMPSEHLQVMIADTPIGGTLEVPEAAYVGPITIDRPITLVGVGDVLIDGAGSGSIVTITSPDVTVRNLSLTGTADGPLEAPSGVLLEGAHRARIEDVTIRESYIGITVRLSNDVMIDGVDIRGQGTIVGESHVTDAGATDREQQQHASHDQGTGVTTEAQIRGDGIWLWNTNGAVIRDTTIEHARDGVYISYGRRATLEANRILDSRYAIHDMYAEDLVARGNVLEGNLSGLVLMYGGPVTVAANTITESGSPSTGFGVLVKDVGSVTIEGNVIADNRVGVQTDDAGRTGGDPTMVRGNTIAMNAIGLMLRPSTDVLVTENGFIENSTQVTLGGEGVTQADFAPEGVGNHWSDYGGFDADGDGTGDLAYVRSGRMSELLAQEPLLLALSSGPAFRLLASVGERWAPGDPLVSDQAPTVRSMGPDLRADRDDTGVPIWIAGLAMTATCLFLMVRARRPRGAVTADA